jgi:hypothetical protein
MELLIQTTDQFNPHDRRIVRKMLRLLPASGC